MISIYYAEIFTSRVAYSRKFPYSLKRIYIECTADSQYRFQIIFIVMHYQGLNKDCQGFNAIISVSHLFSVMNNNRKQMTNSAWSICQGEFNFLTFFNINN